MAKRSKEPYWKYGEKTEMAELCGISSSNFGSILCRRRGVSVEMAKRLSMASTYLGKDLVFEDFLLNRYSKHPAFSGKPLTKKIWREEYKRKKRRK